MNSGLNSALMNLIPPMLQEKIGEFVGRRMTGQVALNFKDGKILSFDIKQHSQVTGIFCVSCGKCKRPEDRTWRVINRKAYCGDCQT